MPYNYRLDGPFLKKRGFSARHYVTQARDEHVVVVARSRVGHEDIAEFRVIAAADCHPHAGDNRKGITIAARQLNDGIGQRCLGFMGAGHGVFLQS
jgi:hypothetical protein